jgi:hypothetical protein
MLPTCRSIGRDWRTRIAEMHAGLYTVERRNLVRIRKRSKYSYAGRGLRAYALNLTMMMIDL